MDGDIILDCCIKTHDGWVVRVKLLGKSDNSAQLATAPFRKYIYALHVELGHPSKSITHTTAKVIGIQVTTIFQSCEDCTLDKAKQGAVHKKAVA